MISSPAGNTPAWVILRTASPAASIEGKSASSTHILRSTQGHRIAVAMPSVPSLPMKPAQIERGAVGEILPKRVTSPSEHHLHGEDVVAVTPYFRQCTPPEFSATLPPMLQITWLEGSGRNKAIACNGTRHPAVDHPGFHRDRLVWKIHGQDPTHATGDDQQASSSTSAPPDSPVPLPRATKGMPRA